MMGVAIGEQWIGLLHAALGAAHPVLVKNSVRPTSLELTHTSL
jgi:hypothetical protein